MSYATVVNVENGRVKLKLYGENISSQVSYYYLASYQPVIGDIVLVDTKLKIVIGRVNL